MANTGRNDPCPCGSGKKYKKCHLYASKVPSPEFLRKLMLDTQRRIESEKFTGPPSMKLPLGPDQVGRVIWNAIHIRPNTETFHEFIINVLKWTVGQGWYAEQVKLASEDRHVIVKWCYAFGKLTQTLIPPDALPGQVHFAPLTGEVKELLVLADDLYRLQLVRKLPRKVVQRLKSYEAFQGARYEVAIAATFIRCDFDIEWIDEKAKKHCEFNATHKATGETIAVETKSRHRPGMLNREGDPPSSERLSADVQSLFNQAVEQAPNNRPFAIFIDVNLPHEPEKGWTQKKWVADIEQLLKQYPQATPENPSPYTFLVFTNFAWHYEGSNAAAGAEAILVVHNPTKFPLRDLRTLESLLRSLDSYGVVSNEE
jgi:hypothetical protein